MRTKEIFCKKDLAVPEKVRTFASSKQRTILRFLGCVAVFFATNTAGYADNIRLSISNGCCASKPVIVLCKTEKGSLSSFKCFSFMQRTMENASRVNNSSLTNTPDCESVRDLLPNAGLPLIAEQNNNQQDISSVEGSGIVGNNLYGNENASVSGNENSLHPQTNNVEQNTGITGISGTAHTIYNYACPPEIIEFIRLLAKKGGLL
jgi:hypothetical protein